MNVLHLLGTQTVVLMIWNVMRLQNFRGQQLGAIVATLYFKLANGFAVLMLSLMTPRAWS